MPLLNYCFLETKKKGVGIWIVSFCYLCLARLQGGTIDKQTSIPPLTDRDCLVQFISNLSASTEVNTSSRSSVPGGFDLDVSQLPPLGSLEQSTKATGNENATSATTNLLTVLLAALAASAPDSPASLSQGSTESSGNDRTKTQSIEPPS